MMASPDAAVDGKSNSRPLHQTGLSSSHGDNLQEAPVEKRRLKIRVAGVYHLGELALGLTPAEQKSVDSLVADGMDKKQAREFALQLRKDQSSMTLAMGSIITVIGKTSWPAETDEPNPLLIVQSSLGVLGLIRESNTERADG